MCETCPYPPNFPAYSRLPRAVSQNETEADTCRKFVVPKLLAAGWDAEPHSIAEQRSITDGRIVPVGKGFIRKPPKRVDYLLRYARDFNLAVVEVRRIDKQALRIKCRASAGRETA